MTLCRYCGWGDWVRPSCETRSAALSCGLNVENVRKYCLRFRGDGRPRVVRSVRYQGGDGKGDSFEFLELVGMNEYPRYGSMLNRRDPAIQTPFGFWDGVAICILVAFYLVMIFADTAARSQDGHGLHHAQYQNWQSNEGFSCCNNQDCGALADSRVREIGGHIEVLVLDNLGDQWCPVELRHLIDQTRGKHLSPDWSKDHACIVSYASGGVCAKLKCFMEKGKF